MAVAQDAICTTPIDNTAGGTSFSGSINLTVGSSLSNGYLTVRIGWSAAVVSAISCTWDSGGTNQAMTQIGLASNSTGPNTAAIFGLVNPTAGNKTLALSWTGSVNEINIVGESWSGVDQTTPTSSVQTINNNTLAANATLSLPAITSAVGNFCIGAFMDDWIWASANQTQEFFINGTHATSIYNRAAGAASVTLTATNSTHVSHCCAIGCNLNAASAGAAVVPGGGRLTMGVGV